MDLSERFWSKVHYGPDCWEWRGIRNGGYGQFSGPDGVLVYAHRWAYEASIGLIPDGFQIDHLCRNKACVRPDHLEAVTPRTNTLRGFGPTSKLARATHCVHGHEFTPENTYLRSSSRPGRECRACWKARRAAQKAAS